MHVFRNGGGKSAADAPEGVSAASAPAVVDKGKGKRTASDAELEEAANAKKEREDAAKDDADDDDDDSDDEDVESHGINARSLLSSAGFGRPIQLDMTKSLREQLQELDDMGAFNDHDVDMDALHDEDGDLGDHDHDGHGETEGEGGGGHGSDPDSPTYTYNGASSGSSTTLGSRGGETPPPPPTPPNGDATPTQLKRLPPDSEAPSAALKAEGFMDSSESPLKV